MSILDPARARAEAERELEEGIALLKAAHHRKLKAIQILEMMAVDGDSRDEPEEAKSKPKPLKRGELPAAFGRVLPKLNEKFDKAQVYAALKAFEPGVAERAGERSISLLLSRLASKKENIEVAEKGEGRAPTTYRRLGSVSDG